MGQVQGKDRMLWAYCKSYVRGGKSAFGVAAIFNKTKKRILLVLFLTVKVRIILTGQTCGLESDLPLPASKGTSWLR